VADHAADVLDDVGLDALRRLVEDEQARAGGERAGDGELLLLAAREVSASTAQELAQELAQDREEVEQLGREGGAARGGGERRLEILLDREKRKDFSPLGNMPDAGPGMIRRPETRDITIFPGNSSDTDFFSPMMARIREDFPTPLRPSTATTSPGLAVRETPRRQSEAP
jgi:general stress protein YciG